MCVVRSYTTAQYYSRIYLVVAPDVIEKIYVLNYYRESRAMVC